MLTRSTIRYSKLFDTDMKMSNNSCDIKLILPSEEYSDQIQAYKDSFEGNFSSMHGSGGLAALDVNQWLVSCRDYMKGKNLPDGHVPSTQFIGVRISDNKLVGMLSLRHTLNEFLAHAGGHIGYSVRADERCKGYAKEMLRQALEVCRQMGISDVLITCNRENTASAKTIEVNGGILENEVESHGDIMKRYWIKLN